MCSPAPKGVSGRSWSYHAVVVALIGGFAGTCATAPVPATATESASDEVLGTAGPRPPEVPQTGIIIGAAVGAVLLIAGCATILLQQRRLRAVRAKEEREREEALRLYLEERTHERERAKQGPHKAAEKDAPAKGALSPRSLLRNTVEHDRRMGQGSKLDPASLSGVSVGSDGQSAGDAAALAGTWVRQGTLPVGLGDVSGDNNVSVVLGDSCLVAVDSADLRSSFNRSTTLQQSFEYSPPAGRGLTPVRSGQHPASRAGARERSLDDLGNLFPVNVNTRAAARTVAGSCNRERFGRHGSASNPTTPGRASVPFPAPAVCDWCEAARPATVSCSVCGRLCDVCTLRKHVEAKPEHVISRLPRSASSPRHIASSPTLSFSPSHAVRPESPLTPLTAAVEQTCSHCQSKDVSAMCTTCPALLCAPCAAKPLICLATRTAHDLHFLCVVCRSEATERNTPTCAKCAGHRARPKALQQQHQRHSPKKPPARPPGQTSPPQPPLSPPHRRDQAFAM